MGQHSSKRRSYTPGQDVQSEIPTNSLVNGDVTANGGIESHDKDVQMRTPKAHKPAERQSSSAGGKKDKSKKIRIIGISLRRTPSGRWTRKRRSMRANGSARPASCPVTDLKPKEKGAQLRPQSLFEEEVITEEDGKIETVDLSDNEDREEAKSSQAAAGPVPKPRDKKVKRSSSDKRQGSKKKKKDKKSSKKEKPKRPTSPKTSKAPDVPATSSDVNTESMDNDAKPEESTDEDLQKQNETKDNIDEVASSIVSESINIARDRYISEQDTTGENAALQSDEAKAATENVAEATPSPVEDVIETPRSVTENQYSPVTDASSAEVDEDMIIPSQSLVREMVPIIFKMNDDNNVEEDEKQNGESDEKLQEPIEVQVEVNTDNDTETETGTRNLNDFSPPSASADLISETKEDAEEVVEEELVQEKVDRVKTLPVVSISSPEDENENAKDDEDCSAETESKEHVGPQTDTNDLEPQSVIPISAESIKNDVVEMVQATPDDKDNEHDQEKENAAENVIEHTHHVEATVSDNEGEKHHKTKHSKEQKEKEKAEKERLKKQKDEEKAKEKERLKEEKRKKAEQKSSEKIKLRPKAERKSTITKRLSDWFKKDKTKTSDPSSTTAGEDGAGPSGVVADANIDIPTQPEHSNTEASASSTLPLDSSASESLTVDVSVQPLSDLASIETGQDTSPPPSPSDNASPDSAPVSPVSNDISDSDPATPTSDGEKSESSGLLKKILLGPRLRTAILRKKSSGASDNGAEENRVSLTQPKGVETADVTAPPRKLRPRKPVEQYSPVTTGAHNPLKNPSPRLEHTDKDSLADESEFDTSCPESLPKTEDNDTDKDLSSSVVADVPNVVTNDVTMSSQSIDDHPSIEIEPNVGGLQTTVEHVENSQETSSSELQSSSNVISEVIEHSQTLNISSVETLSSKDNATPSEEVKEESVGSVALPLIDNETSEEVREESVQIASTLNEISSEEVKEQSVEIVVTPSIDIATFSEEVKEESVDIVTTPSIDDATSPEEEKEENVDIVTTPSIDDAKSSEEVSEETVEEAAQSSIENTSSKEVKEVIVESVCNEVKSEINQNENTENDSRLNPVCVDSENKVSGEEEASLESPTIISTARIVLRSTSSEGSKLHDNTSDVLTASENQPENESLDPFQVEVPDHKEEITLSESVDKDSNESHKETIVLSKDVESSESFPVSSPEVEVYASDKPEEKLQIFDVIARTSDDEKLESDDPEEDESTSSQYTVVCTAMASEEPIGDIAAPAGESMVDTDKGVGEHQEDGKSVDTEDTHPINEEADTVHEDTPSDASIDNNDAMQSTSSSSSSSTDHWESPKLNIQLDDSAIEMDKESPLADTQSPVSIDSSSGVSSIKHDDEGVNSDHSSDTNDNSSDGADKRNEDNTSKADSSDTIEAYLKLQQHVDVTDVSPKNHIVDRCGLLESEDFGLQSENGVDGDGSHGDKDNHKNTDEQTTQVSSLSS